MLCIGPRSFLTVCRDHFSKCTAIISDKTTLSVLTVHRDHFSQRNGLTPCHLMPFSVPLAGLSAPGAQPLYRLSEMMAVHCEKYAVINPRNALEKSQVARRNRAMHRSKVK